MEKLKEINSGFDTFSKRINNQKRLYKKVFDYSVKQNSNQTITKIEDKRFFNLLIEAFGPSVSYKKAKSHLMDLYDIGFHKETGALIISNKGATLYSMSPKTDTPHIVRHIGFCVYMPGLGVEFVNVGLVGNVYEGKVILRSESACTPSFLFGSQRCNCNHQWDSVRELAAYFNRVKTPSLKNGKDFEKWVQKQVTYKKGKHIFNKNVNGQGLILMHVDTQNGMGSGYTPGEFCFDLFSRASIRHRGEYSAEQIDNATMWGGFEAIGINADPRRENENIGYKITFAILDYLRVSKDIIFLTNNPLKLQHLERNGYKLSRIKTLGAINLAGALEAEERGEEFHHLDIDEHCVSFKDEFERLKKEIKGIIKE
jgi:GTP cyclohydrolase II